MLLGQPELPAGREGEGVRAKLLGPGIGGGPNDRLGASGCPAPRHIGERISAPRVAADPVSAVANAIGTPGRV